MKQRLAHFIKRWPTLYRYVSKVYWTLQFQHLMELLIGAKARERWWATRSIAEAYWNNRDLPNKHFLVERIAAFQPIHSILEVGCASGPNLYPLAKKFPQAEIVGIDINPRAVQYGNAQFAREGISNVKLLVGKADKLGEFQDGAFDIVFTNALLMHIGPEKIEEVIKGMIRITQQALVIMELHCFEPNIKDQSGLGTYLSGFPSGIWARDYVALLKQFVSEEHIQVTKIPEGIFPAKPWKELGAVIEVLCDKANEITNFSLIKSMRSFYNRGHENVV